MSLWLSRPNNNRNFEVSPVQKLFQGMIDDMWDNRWGQTLHQDKPLTGFSPKLNIKETDTSLMVATELPGLDAKEVEITVDQQYLTISGEKKLETHKDDKGAHYYECSYGTFVRKVPLPFEVNMEKVEAKFEKGVLNINLEKAESARTQKRKISIKNP